MEIHYLSLNLILKSKISKNKFKYFLVVQTHLM